MGFVSHTHIRYPFESGDMIKIQTESNNQSAEYFDSIVTIEAGFTHVKLCRHTEVFMDLKACATRITKAGLTHTLCRYIRYLTL